MALLPYWGSLKTVAKIHSSFESLETISLAVAILFELTGMQHVSNVAWVALVISDVARQLYGRREKGLSEKAAAESNAERAKIKEQLTWRVITDEQRKSLVAQLSKFAGQRVCISIWPVLAELATFQHFVAATLKQAGWNWSLVSIPGPPVLTNGFVVLSTPDAQSKEAAESLRKALDPMGGGGSGIIGNLDKPEDPRVHIVIQERGGPYPDDVLFR